MFKKSFLPEILETKSQMTCCSPPTIWAVDTPAAGERGQRLSVCLAAKGSIVLKYEPDPT